MPRKTIIASDLREDVDIQGYTTTNTKGHKTKSWSTSESDVPAMIDFESDAERVRNGRTEADQSIKVTMRAEMESDVDQTKRLLWEGDYWMVAGIPGFVDRRRRFIRFPAVRTDADAEPS